MKISFLKKCILTIVMITSTQAYSFGQLTPLSLGSIAPNDSIVVQFDVTINNPVTAGTMYIATQAAVSGSNFASLVTDDPETVITSDSTKTQLAFVALPVNFINFKAYEHNKKVNLEWKVAQQINVSHYEIQRSADGVSFSSIGNVAAINSSSEIVYNHTDIQPLSGANFYRIRSIDIDGKTKYTSVIRINLNGIRSIVVTPNPIRNQILNLQLNNIEAGVYELSLYSMAGQALIKYQVQHGGGSRTEQLILPGQLAKGAYHIVIKREGIVFSKMILVH